MSLCKHISSIPKTFQIPSTIRDFKDVEDELYVCLTCMKVCKKMTHMKQHSNQRKHLMFWMKLSTNYGCLFCCKCKLEILETSPSLLVASKEKVAELTVNRILDDFKCFFANDCAEVDEQLEEAQSIKPKRISKRIEERITKGGGIGKKPSGLRNLGNTCFMNSVLQLLSITPFLPEGQEHLGPIRSSLSSLLMLLRNSSNEKNIKSSISPSHFFQAISNRFTFLEANEQQDSHDFIHLLFNSLEEEGKELGNSSGLIRETTDLDIKDVFGGEIEIQIVCCDCKYKCRRMESLVDISLPLREESIIQGMRGMSICNHGDEVGIDIESLIMQWGKQEMMSGDNAYQCPECQKDSKAHKQTIFRKHPQILMVHLQRFVVGNITKRTKRAKDPNGEFGYSKDNSPINVPSSVLLDSSFSSYDLIGAIIHLGSSPEFGHYVSLIKKEDGQFYLISDCDVTALGSNDGGDDGRIRSTLSKAYILFYKRRNK